MIAVLMAAVLLMLFLGATGRIPMGWVMFKIAPVVVLFAIIALMAGGC